MLFILLIFPQVFLFSSTAGQSRIKSLSIINKESEQNKQSKQFSITRPLSLYVAYYSPRNLFFDPDPDRQRSLPELSVFYPWMIAPFIAGLYLFFREKVAGNKKIILFMLFISPIPASFAGDPFSSLRASPLIFPMTVIISFGIDRIFQFLKNNILKVALITLILCVSLTSLYRNLFVLLPGERFNDWNYGYSQLIEKIKTTPAPKILINDPKGTSYIELLFFLRQSPKDYQSQTLGNRPQNYYNDGVWVNTFSWSNIQVRPIIWKDDIYTYQLLVSSPLGISEDQAKEHYLTKAFDIIGPDRRIIFNGYLTNPLLKNSDDKAKLKKMLK